MQSLGDNINAVVVGASGAIGSALVAALAARADVSNVYAASRSAKPFVDSKITSLQMDVTDERSIELAAARCVSSGPLRLVIVATGVLHDGDTLQPEKSWLMLNADRLSKVFAINTIGPALVAKHFLPLLDRHHRCIFAALSARVGSISDNRLGGWYGYRASKAGLNMIIKTLSIELQRRNKFAICLGLHPGTVDSGLSAPFQANVAQPKLFSATRAASELLSVIDQANAEQSGRVLAWDGQEVPS